MIYPCHTKININGQSHYSFTTSIEDLLDSLFVPENPADYKFDQNIGERKVVIGTRKKVDGKIHCECFKNASDAEKLAKAYDEYFVANLTLAFGGLNIVTIEPMNNTDREFKDNLLTYTEPEYAGGGSDGLSELKALFDAEMGFENIENSVGNGDDAVVFVTNSYLLFDNARTLQTPNLSEFYVTPGE